VIDPKRITSNPKPPPVYIEKVFVDGEVNEIYPKSLSAATIPPGKQRLEFHYTGLDLSAPTAVRFRYRLEGYDHAWVHAGTRREAIYTRVPPGHYRFEVKAANNDGVWNESGAVLAVMVMPPWWQTWWLRGVAIVALSGLVFGLYELRVYQHKKARTMQESFARRLIESQEQERKRVAAELHDSLGQSLQIIKGRAQLALSRGDRPDEKDKQFAEISEAATQAIREVRAISHALRPAELDQLGLTKARGMDGAASRRNFPHAICLRTRKHRRIAFTRDRDQPLSDRAGRHQQRAEARARFRGNPRVEEHRSYCAPFSLR
jgi:signal transduction histidine kinase